MSALVLHDNCKPFFLFFSLSTNLCAHGTFVFFLVLHAGKMRYTQIWRVKEKAFYLVLEELRGVGSFSLKHFLPYSVQLLAESRI